MNADFSIIYQSLYLWRSYLYSIYYYLYKTIHESTSIYKRIRLIDILYSVNNSMPWNKPINFCIFHFKPNFNRFPISFRTISLSKSYDFIILTGLLMSRALQTLTCKGKQAHKQLIIWQDTQLCLHLMSSHVSFE